MLQEALEAMATVLGDMSVEAGGDDVSRWRSRCWIRVATSSAHLGICHPGSLLWVLCRAADLEAVPLPEVGDGLSEVVAVSISGIPCHPQSASRCGLLAIAKSGSGSVLVIGE
jgi:hypothetical protein